MSYLPKLLVTGKRSIKRRWWRHLTAFFNWNIKDKVTDMSHEAAWSNVQTQIQSHRALNVLTSHDNSQLQVPFSFLTTYIRFLSYRINLCLQNKYILLNISDFLIYHNDYSIIPNQHHPYRKDRCFSLWSSLSTSSKHQLYQYITIYKYTNVAACDTNMYFRTYSSYLEDSVSGVI